MEKGNEDDRVPMSVFIKKVRQATLRRDNKSQGGSGMAALEWPHTSFQIVAFDLFVNSRAQWGISIQTHFLALATSTHISLVLSILPGCTGVITDLLRTIGESFGLGFVA